MKCRPCLRSEGENFDMPFNLFTSIIDQLNNGKCGTKHVDLTGVGEPLLNPNLVSMIDYAKKGGFQVSFTSNFSLINKTIAEKLIDAKLDFMYISFDAASKKMFEKLRAGSNFEKTISNIELFTRIKKEKNVINPKFRFYVTLGDENLGEIEGIIKIADELGINSINFNRQIVPGLEYWKNELPVFLIWEKMSEYKVYIGRRAIPLRRAQYCVALKGCFITYDGKVLPCNRLTQLIPRKEYLDHYFGDLNNKSLSEVWFSSEYRKFRTKLAFGSHPSICNYCTHSYQM